MIASIVETLKRVEQKFINKDLPVFKVGDTVKMMIKVQEADKTRLHPFEGIIIRKTGKGVKGSFTVRKISFGEGVERIFPLHSPVIENLKVINRGKVKRAKLYYLRAGQTKKTRVAKEHSQPQPVATTAVQS